MAVVTVSGEPGCRTREVAQLAAQRLGYTHVSASRLDALLEEEFGQPVVTSKAWADMAASVLLRGEADTLWDGAYIARNDAYRALLQVALRVSGRDDRSSPMDRSDPTNHCADERFRC